jgi:hypothetical protein
MTKDEQIESLKSEIRRMQNHAVMILEANKRLAQTVASQAAMLRDAENSRLREIIEATRK